MLDLWKGVVMRLDEYSYRTQRILTLDRPNVIDLKNSKL